MRRRSGRVTVVDVPEHHRKEGHVSKSILKEMIELIREDAEFHETFVDELGRIRFELDEFVKEYGSFVGLEIEKLADKLEEEFSELLAALSD
jgi:hypothetical protein